MTTGSDATPAVALCSRLSAERGLPLVGSAGHYDVVVAFELDSPWTPRLVGSRASDPALDQAMASIASGPARLLALEPGESLRSERGDRHSRVLVFSREAGAFSGYARREYDVPRERLAGVLARIAEHGAPAADDLRELEVDPGAARDLLVCTHGARDACCGKFGYGLYLEVAALAASSGRNLRAWRCSHLGGHRFAPTMLDLPSGRMYGRVGEGDAAAVLEGGAALVGRLDRIYRGRCALPEPAQVVERELWRREGAGFAAAALTWSASETGHEWDVSVEVAGIRRHGLRSRVIRAELDAVVTPASCGRDPEREAPWRLLD